MPIYFISYHSVPSSSNSEFSNTKGAYINAWIDTYDIYKAQEIAFAKIAELNWKIVSLEEAKETSREYFRNNPEGLEKYEQTLIDKEVYEIHTYISDDYE